METKIKSRGQIRRVKVDIKSKTFKYHLKIKEKSGKIFLHDFKVKERLSYG